MKNRRDFLKNTTMGCSALVLGAMGISALDACKAKPANAAAGAPATPAVLQVADNTVKLPVADFKDINAKVVYISTGQALLINKNADGTYSAFEYKCPHAGGPLEKQGDELVCPWHDSRFGLDGSLHKGPSKTGLKSYPANLEKDEVVVKLG